MAVSTINRSVDEYHVGDSLHYTDNLYMANAVVGSNGTGLQIVIPLSKSIGSDVSAVTLNRLTIQAFGVSGRFMTNINILTNEDYTTAVQIDSTRTYFRILVTKTSAYDVTVLTPVTIFFGSLEFTFA